VPADSDGGQLVAGGVVVHRAHGDLQIFGYLGCGHHVVLFRTHAAADLHRELGALGADSAHTRALLGESAAVVTERMPALTRELRQLRDEWETQNLLDPPRAKRTLQLAETRLIEAEPELSALRARRKAIVAEMQGLLERARGS
jgi:hypothetical protein